MNALLCLLKETMSHFGEALILMSPFVPDGPSTVPDTQPLINKHHLWNENPYGAAELTAHEQGARLSAREQQHQH